MDPLGYDTWLVMTNEAFKMNLLVESTVWQLPCRKKRWSRGTIAFPFFGARNGRFSEVIRISCFFFFKGSGYIKLNFSNKVQNPFL